MLRQRCAPFLLALLEAKELGDRFRLVVAGRSGGLVITPDDFRFGPLTVALEELLADNEPQTPNALGLPEAVACAIQSVARDDDPTATLGSSMVVSVTGKVLRRRNPSTRPPWRIKAPWREFR